MTARRRGGPGVAGVRWAELKRLALALPGTEERTSYGTPAFKVKGQLFARLREDGDDLALRCELADRELLLEARPAVFHVTDHYRDFPWILVKLAVVRREDLRAVLSQAWRLRAPKKLLAAFDGGLSAAPSPSRRARARGARAKWRS